MTVSATVSSFSTYIMVVIDFSSVAMASLQQATYDASEANGSVMVCVELIDGELERYVCACVSWDMYVCRLMLYACMLHSR